MIWLVAGLAFTYTSCSGNRRIENDAAPDGDADAESDVDADVDDDSDVDADTGLDSDIDSPEDVPHCGDGVTDPEEECDDGNRLNGDGCDWLCRVGNGDPQPSPDPSFAPYEYGGPAVELETGQSNVHGGYERLPFVWTGTEFSTVVLGEPDPSGDRELDFFRFDSEGNRLEDEWLELRVVWASALDLVWASGHYALFFSNLEGLFMRLLSSTGKPLSEPALVVGDPCVFSAAGEIAGEDIALTWDIMDYADSEDAPCNGEGQNPEAGVHASILADDVLATVLHGPVHLVEGQDIWPDIAVGPEKVGISANQRIDTDQTGPVSFTLVDDDLGETTSTGMLGNSYEPSSIVFGDGAFWVSWHHTEDYDPDDEVTDVDEICVARFTPEGMLMDAPVCEAPLGLDHFGPPRIAFGDGGLGIVVPAEFELLFVRTDSAGVVVGDPLEVDPSAGEYEFGPYAIVWADTAFAVLYAAASYEPLSIRRFVESH